MHWIANDATYQSIISGEYKIERALQVGGNDTAEIRNEIPGTVYREDVLKSCRIHCQTFSNEAPMVGACTSRTITIQMLTPTVKIPRQARLVPYVRVTDGTRYSAWIPKGVYWIDTKERKLMNMREAVTEIDGFDSIMKAEQVYVYGGEFPEEGVQDITILDGIASMMGVEIAPETRAIISRGYMIGQPDDYACRELLNVIAAMYGGNFVCDDYGRLKLLRLNDVPALPAPIITIQPLDAIVMDRESASFNVFAFGAASYSWQQKRGNVDWSPVAGASGNVLTLNTVSAMNGTKYRCAVSDERGNVTVSSEATLYVVPATMNRR